MSEILHSSTTKISKWGNSLGVRIKKFYLELAGMDKEQLEVTQAVIKGQHGIFIAHYLQGEQPTEIKEADLEKLKTLEEKQSEQK